MPGALKALSAAMVLLLLTNLLWTFFFITRFSQNTENNNLLFSPSVPKNLDILSAVRGEVDYLSSVRSLLSDDCPRESLEAAFASVLQKALPPLSNFPTSAAPVVVDPSRPSPRLPLKELVPCAKHNNRTVCLPYAVVLGASRAGTTTLWNWLGHHPNLKGGQLKQSSFFCTRDHWNKGLPYYYEFFANHANPTESLPWEVSTRYLSTSAAPPRMIRVLPHAKLIVLVRDPVARAFSNYWALVENQPQNVRVQSFDALALSELENMAQFRSGCFTDEVLASRRLRSDCTENYLLSRGLYIHQIQHWMKFYPREQLLVVESEKLFNQPRETLREIIKFLDIDDDLLPENFKFEPSEMTDPPRPMSNTTREALQNYFKPYNRKLEEYLGQKFSWAS
eukprot:TRINITY_DN10700_c0_g1_i1.p1 TRINITY_DN10700_c0_g1~~TRINITY_DN10700_c0_g1_i1.p1  ORF type:complete len:394 (-),score=66.18 TRINITY_DN10700_c0_g1_i1:54-1235(-)